MGQESEVRRIALRNDLFRLQDELRAELTLTNVEGFLADVPAHHRVRSLHSREETR